MSKDYKMQDRYIAIKILKVLKQELYAEDRVLLMRALSLCIRLLEREEKK